ncbi:MAG: 30S ribosomal protein S24e [Candidatus Helarchaeota archaeon]|nr:30S ribosomal protein S24e [Candidatus Helarchaeota archaeon]
MSIKLIIKKEFDNLLLNRKQIDFELLHQKMSTPTRAEVKSKLAAQFNVKPDRVIISKLTPKFGQAFTVGYAKIYNTKEDAETIEPKHSMKRNQPKAKKKEKE